MKKAVLAAVLSVFVSAPTLAQDTQDWGYIGAGAPHKWAALNPAYSTCKTGAEQSPVNIDRFAQVALPPITAAYNPSALEVANDGRTVQVNYEPGSGFSVDGKAYELVQIQFHTPSEHYIDGAPYPMEAHFIHTAQDGSLAVIGVMMKVGVPNPTIEGIWQNVPMAGKVKNVSGVSIDASNLMPEDKSYYTYRGSLTTPPCREGVQWYLLKDEIELSATQLKAFQAVYPVNARPIQDLGARTVSGN